MGCSGRPRRRASTERNGSGDTGCSSPWRRSPGPSRSRARQRDSEDAACLVVSPDELNAHPRTVIVAPMTTASRAPIPGACRAVSSADPALWPRISCGR
jgi:hypothetical protein